MKNHVIPLIIVMLTNSLLAQGISGKWEGTVRINESSLQLVFNIAENSTGYCATMDSPDPGANALSIPKATFVDSILKLEMPTANFIYEGAYRDSLIVGILSQNNQQIPLDLRRQGVQKEVRRRPQDPEKPYPYLSENVVFDNPIDKISLAGTLTIPKNEGVFPAVILISGSGPQNRDEELMGHRPFLVLSDYLTRNSIAVLRFDDRGGGESTGDFNAATTADFATDVSSAVTYLKTRKEIDQHNIGLIGHSEGGLVAPMVAADSNDVGFIVLMAGSGIRGDKLLLLQERLIENVLGTSDSEIENLLHTNTRIFDIILNSKNDENLAPLLREMLANSFDGEFAPKIPDGMTQEDFISAQINLYTSPWVKYFLRHDPAETLKKVRTPVLAINGEKDLQVPPEENLYAIRSALKAAGNERVTLKEYKDLNHLFQESVTGSPMEYSVIEQTISPLVLKEVTHWIILQLK